MTTITAFVVADSIGAHGPRLTTMLLRYPRCIHAEFMTHRVFSRNASSSRAVPVKKLIKDVLDDPFVPLFWGANQKGMQAGEECGEPIGLLATDGSKRIAVAMNRKQAWLYAMERAIEMAEAFDRAGYHKQIVNRLLEPFSHITVVVTATQWSNFFALRRHLMAEPHIHQLADRMFEAMSASTPKLLQSGQWHLPFADSRDDREAELCRSRAPTSNQGDALKEAIGNLLKLSVARCASTSYKTVDGHDMTLERAVALHDRLIADTPLHASPCEHQAEVDDPDLGVGTMGGNLGPGWIQYRKTLPGECL